MVTRDQLSKMSVCVAALIGEMMESRYNVDSCADPNLNKNTYQDRLIDSLFKIEAELKEIDGHNDWQTKSALFVAFSNVNSSPIKTGRQLWAVSIHAAMVDLARDVIASIMGDVLEAYHPEIFIPGKEVLLPDSLWGKDELLKYIDIVIRSGADILPSLDKLNELQALREQELNRAIGKLPLELPLTTELQQAKFCFEQNKSGKSYKQINAELRRREEFHEYRHDSGVRGPINKWRKHIGMDAE